MTEKHPEKFYNAISVAYDEMTDFSARFEREVTLMKSLQRKFGFTRVLDAACGSGIHTIALKRIGVESAGVDISPEMIHLAQRNAAEEGVSAYFRAGALSDLSDFADAGFDGLLFLGNSLPHILESNELTRTFDEFARVLKSGSPLIIQILNYTKTLKDKERIVSIREKHQKEFIRFYDFLEPGLRFNLLEIDHSQNPPKHNLNSVLLHPYTLEEIEPVLQKAGFRTENIAGNMQFDAFNPESSANLVGTFIKK